MNHRVKNLFAVANALLALSVRSARTPQDLAAAVRERLAALSRAHDLILPDWTDRAETSSQGTTLEAVVRAIFAPYMRDGHDCLETGGPDVAIGAGAVTEVALVLHECAINAAKYGALSVPGGRVGVDWKTENGRLLLRWRESGGPPVAGPPAAEGFGSLLARRTVTGHFGGALSHDWRPEGLTIQLAVPLKRLG
jgi:two-component system CheB/CheR fusion protein